MLTYQLDLDPPPPPHPDDQRAYIPPPFHPNHLVRLRGLDDYGTKGQSQITAVSLHLRKLILVMAVT